MTAARALGGSGDAAAAAGDAVFVGGTFSEIRPPEGAAGAPVVQANLASFDAATGNPTSCQPDVTLSGATPTVRALELSPDGKTLGFYSNRSGNWPGVAGRRGRGRG